MLLQASELSGSFREVKIFFTLLLSSFHFVLNKKCLSFCKGKLHLSRRIWGWGTLLIEIWGREQAVAPGQAHHVGSWGSLPVAWERGAGLATCAPCTGAFAEVFQGQHLCHLPFRGGNFRPHSGAAPFRVSQNHHLSTPGYCNHSNVCIIIEIF